MKLNKLYFAQLLLVPAILIVSCTDLTENLNNEVPADQFFQTDEEFISALGDAYGSLTQYGGNAGITAINEVTSDEIVVGHKGADWEDGGVWIRLHRHTFTPSDDVINNTWNEFFNGVANANRLIFQFQTVVDAGDVSQEDADAFIAELRAIRAFYYYILLDNFGNVPIVTDFEQNPEETAQPSSNFQEGRQQVFDFVEEELLEAAELVDDDVSATTGRVNKWVVHMTLAKLYMNAEVYTGTPRWQDAIEQTDIIIDSGNYSLSANYLDNFAVDNTDSPENIFIIPFDEVFLEGFNLHMMTNHILSQPAFDFGAQPWNGFQTVTEFYGSYIDPDDNPGPQGDVVGLDPEGSTVTGTQDERLGNFLAGPLLNLQGNQIEDDGAESSDPDGPPITHTPYLNELTPGNWRQSGARIAKYEMEIGLSGEQMNNDMVIYRYADVLLMKAEALWRLNAGDTDALMLVNEIRERAGVDGFDSLDADKLLAERGRELFWEIVRRQDQIRFSGEAGETRFNDAWWEKNQSEVTRNVFPIPDNQLESNTNLVQNPGY